MRSEMYAASGMEKENAGEYRGGRRMHSTEAVKLTPDQWQATADFVNGLADLVCDLLPEDSTYAGDVRRIAGYAAGAALYVAQYAAEECVFSMRDVKEEKNEADD